MSLRYERIIPLALLVSGLAGGLGAWIDHRRAPPRPAVSPALTEPLNRPKLSERSRRKLDQQTARALIVGLEALSIARSAESPTEREAKANLAQIRSAVMAYGVAFGLEELNLPSCPEAAPKAGAQPWTGDCAEQWGLLGWTPELDEEQDPDELPLTLCRYGAVGTGPLEFEVIATCAPGYGGAMEQYRATEGQHPAKVASAAD